MDVAWGKTCSTGRHWFANFKEWNNEIRAKQSSCCCESKCQKELRKDCVCAKDLTLHGTKTCVGGASTRGWLHSNTTLSVRLTHFQNDITVVTATTMLCISVLHSGRFSPSKQSKWLLLYECAKIALWSFSLVLIFLKHYACVKGHMLGLRKRMTGFLQLTLSDHGAFSA